MGKKKEKAKQVYVTYHHHQHWNKISLQSTSMFHWKAATCQERGPEQQHKAAEAPVVTSRSP